MLKAAEAKTGVNITEREGPEKTPETGKSMFSKLGIKPKGHLYYEMPVCVVANKEFSSIQTLRSTSLLEAGISAAGALVRVLFKTASPDSSNKRGTKLQDLLEEIRATPSSTVEVSKSGPNETSDAKGASIKISDRNSSLLNDTSVLSETQDMDTKKMSDEPAFKDLDAVPDEIGSGNTVKVPVEDADNDTAMADAQEERTEGDVPDSGNISNTRHEVFPELNDSYSSRQSQVSCDKNIQADSSQHSASSDRLARVLFQIISD